MRNNFAILALLLLFSVSALAEDRAMITHAPEAEQECKMQETAQVGVNFNNINLDVADAKTLFDKKIEDAKAFAKEAGIETIDIQSYNYNVYDNNSGDCSGSNPGGSYQVSGNVNFDIRPIDKAAAYAAILAKNGFSASLNVNGYKQCQ